MLNHKNSKEISVIAAILFCFCAFKINAETTPEPENYRTSDYRGSVPDTVSGAQVIDSPATLKSMIDTEDPVLIDVYPAPNKPDDLAPGTLWIEPRRDTLPGALWLANTGHGILPDNLITLLQTYLPDDRPVVIFCEPRCWHSWNAAKRAVELGAKNVYWYRNGVTGWSEAGYPLETHTPVRQ